MRKGNKNTVCGNHSLVNHKGEIQMEYPVIGKMQLNLSFFQISKEKWICVLCPDV